jgi:hypothetical protein
MNKTLVAGWFSFEEMGASAGDIMARDLACQWLEAAGYSYDVALAPPFTGGVDWRLVDPRTYTDVLFVCGPFGNGWPVTDFLTRFVKCRLIGLNLSMLEPLESWNPFKLLFERDSSIISRPDISFLSTQDHVPVVGIILIDTQNEYGKRDSHILANEALRRLADNQQVVRINIDTRLDINTTGLRTAAEIETLIARMDLILTTRLHGMALGLKNGVPVIAVDSVVGGGKITRQARTIGWPFVIPVEELSDESMRKAFDYCLTEQARSAARLCSQRAKKIINEIRSQFIYSLTHTKRRS